MHIYKKNNSAFTLVELLVVITIVGILAAIGIVSFQKYISWARDTQRVADITEIEKLVTTFNTNGYAPKSLGLLDDSFKEYPVDPDNGFGYQYNANTKWASSRYKNATWKGFMICSNRPLERYSDQNGDVLPDYLDKLEVDDRSKFISWKIRNTVSGSREDIAVNEVIAYYCVGQTDDFSSLVAWGGSNSLWTANCDSTILNPDLPISERWAACKVVFNADSSAQATGESPAAGTPFTMTE